MYMMFIYVDDKIHNSMGIRGELDELHKIAEQKSINIFKENPHAVVTTKNTMYI